MARAYSHIARYGPFGGLHDNAAILRAESSNYAAEAENVMRYPGQDGLTSRRGAKEFWSGLSNLQSGVGLWSFQRINPQTGAATPELLTLGAVQDNASLRRSVSWTYTITCVNTSGTALVVDHFYDTVSGHFRFRVQNASRTATYYSENSETKSPQTLLDELNAIASAPLASTTWAASGTALTSPLASASLEVFYGASVSSGAGTVAVGRGRIWNDIPHPHRAGDVPTTSRIERGPDEEIAATLAQNCIYFASQSRPVWKYDGLHFYRAGLPFPKNPLLIALGGTDASRDIPAGSYAYCYTYEFTDAQGNVIETPALGTRQIPTSPTLGYTIPTPSGPGTITAAGTGPINVPLPIAITQVQGFNTGFEVSSATQSLSNTSRTLTVALTTTSNPGMAVGATATFRAADADSRIFLIRARIESITDTGLARSITLSDDYTWQRVGRATDSTGKTGTWAIGEGKFSALGSATYAVAIDARISNQLVTKVYRSKNLGTAAPNFIPSFYACDIYPIAAGLSEQTIVDFKHDDELGEQLLLKNGSDVICFADSQFIVPGTTATRSDQFTLPSARYLENFQERLYLAGDDEAPNTLYRSSIFWGPEFVDPTGFDNLNMETPLGDNIRALRGAGTHFIVGKSRSIKRISGDLASATNIRVEDLSLSFGILSHTGCAVFYDTIVAPTVRGPVAIDARGSLTWPGASPEFPESPLERTFGREGEAALRRTWAVSHQRDDYFAIWVPSGTLFVYRIAAGAWFSWTTDFRRIFGLCVHEDQLAWMGDTDNGSATVGQLRLESQSRSRYDYVSATGGAIPTRYSTRWETMTAPLVTKFFLKARIYNFEPQVADEQPQTVTLAAYTDWIASAPTSERTTTLASSPGDVEVKLSTRKSRSIQLSITTSLVAQRFALSGIELEASAAFRPKIKEH